MRGATAAAVALARRAQPKRLRRVEGETQKAILAYLHARGVLAWRQNTGAVIHEATERSARRFVQFGAKGISDVLGVLGDGRILAIEVKRRGKRATVEQENFIRAVNARGGTAFVAFSVEDVAIQLGWAPKVCPEPRQEPRDG